MASEPENLVLQILRDMRAEMGDMRAEITDIRAQMPTKSDLAELRSELKSDMHSLRADVAADLISTRRDLSEQIVGLRRAVMEYHSTTIGHGMLIGDLDERVSRLERQRDPA